MTRKLSLVTNHWNFSNQCALRRTFRASAPTVPLFCALRRSFCDWTLALFIAVSDAA
jgi:hypothetical protein